MNILGCKRKNDFGSECPFNRCLGNDCDLPKITNKEFLQSATDEQLCSFVKQISYEQNTPWDDVCKSCKPVKTAGDNVLRECDFIDGVCPHKDPIIWWLNQEYNKEDSVWKE